MTTRLSPTAGFCGSIGPVVRFKLPNSKVWMLYVDWKFEYSNMLLPMWVVRTCVSSEFINRYKAYHIDGLDIIYDNPESNVWQTTPTFVVLWKYRSEKRSEYSRMIKSYYRRSVRLLENLDCCHFRFNQRFAQCESLYKYTNYNQRSCRWLTTEHGAVDKHLKYIFDHRTSRG